LRRIIIATSFCILILSSKQYYDVIPKILPVQCHNNKYLDKLLDELRYAESSNGKYVLNINRNKKGKELSRDEGDYQHNNKYSIYDADEFNDGKRFNPYDKEIARNIARQKIVKNYKLSGNYFDSLIMYNCGYDKWLIKAPYKSFLFAERIMKRIYNNLRAVELVAELNKEEGL
jgi:hypothetical protein